MRRKNLKTLLLGLGVILITSTLFVGLPVLIPELDSVSFDTIVWACTRYGGPPVIWDTWMWINAEQPDEDTWVKAHFYRYLENDIRNELHRTGFNAGLGALQIVPDPDNLDGIIVFGYLQYGEYTDAENLTVLIPKYPVHRTPEYEIYRNTEIFPGIRELFLEDCPVPFQFGVLLNREITITFIQYFEGRTVKDKYQVRTDDNGYFSFALVPDSTASYYEIIPEFEAETILPKTEKKFYPPAKTLPGVVMEPQTAERVQFIFETACIYSSQGSGSGGYYFLRSNWWWLVASVIIVGSLLYYFIWFRKRIVVYQSLGIEEIGKPEKTRREKAAASITGGDTDFIGITFPDIDTDLPDVWGVDDSLKAFITLKENKYLNQTCEIIWGDGERTDEVIVDNGEAEQVHIFTLKGEYGITAAYRDVTFLKEVSAWRKIRVVDYREEMVRLFGEMLEELNLGDVKIEPDMTPREVEKLLTERLSGMSKEICSKVIDGFEEANYSTHPVNRESYVKMYRGIEEVTEISNE